MAGSLDAALTSVGLDLKTYHDATMGLPDNDMQQLISSVTCRMPEPACPQSVTQ
jgi:hypothetical protein